MKSLRLTTTFLIIFVLFSIIVWSAEAKKHKKVTIGTNTNFVNPKQELHERSDTNPSSKRELSDELLDAEFRKRSDDSGFGENPDNELKRDTLSKRASINWGGPFTRNGCRRICRSYRFFFWCNCASPRPYCVCFNR